MPNQGEVNARHSRSVQRMADGSLAADGHALTELRTLPRGRLGQEDIWNLGTVECGERIRHTA